MRRRLTIARSLINEPELLLLDEPTTGLDPQARHLLWDRLFRLKQSGVSLIVTTHYMDEAEQLCDRLVVMDGGRIAAEGSPAELISQYSTTGGARAAVRLRRAGRRRGRPSPLSPSASRCFPIGCCSTSPTARACSRRVHTQGVRPTSTLVRRSTLEDVFLRLTGRSLVD